MPVGNHKTVLWYSINNGRIRHAQDGQESFFDYIEGLLISIERKVDEYKGKPSPKYYFKFEPEDHGYTEILKVGENSSALRGILASLTTIPDDQIRQVQLRPYVNTTVYDGEPVEFTNVDVSYRADSSQGWTRLIEVEETKGLYQRIFKKMPEDEAQRVQYLQRMADAIIARMNNAPAEPAPQPQRQADQEDDPTQNLYGEPSIPKSTPKPTEIHNNDDDDSDLPF